MLDLFPRGVRLGRHTLLDFVQRACLVRDRNYSTKLAGGGTKGLYGFECGLLVAATGHCEEDPVVFTGRKQKVLDIVPQLRDCV